jgi:hypothetical protein
MTLPIAAAEAPITEDDAAIAAALERASIPTLLVSLVHVTGEAELVRGDVRPARALQLLASDALCFEVTLATVTAADGARFKAKAP